jgi:hypothetical protein
VKVVLCGGPKGGEIVEWGDNAKDGDTQAFEGCHYRIDFLVGQAVFVGMDEAPRPTTFKSVLA